MNRKRRKLNPEEQEELNKQYLTIATLLIKLVGETAHGRFLRALLVGGIVAAAQWATGGEELPEGGMPERFQTAPATPPPVVAAPIPKATVTTHPAAPSTAPTK